MLRRIVRDHDDVNFVIIYTREPHARQMAFKDIGQPLDWKERRDLAALTKKELSLDLLILIDEMGDPSRKLLGDLPNPVIFVEQDGKIHDKLAWGDASEIGRVLESWSAVPKKAKKKTEEPTSRPSEAKEGPTSQPSGSPAPRSKKEVRPTPEGGAEPAKSPVSSPVPPRPEPAPAGKPDAGGKKRELPVPADSKKKPAPAGPREESLSRQK